MPSLDLTPANTVKKIEHDLDYALYLSLETKMCDPEDASLPMYEKYARELQCQLVVAKLLTNIKDKLYA